MRLTKKIRGLKNIFLANFFGFKYPLHAELRFTNRCNQDCIYCDCKSRPKKEMTTKEIIQFIDEIHKNNFHLTLTGEEPLLREDIGKIISYIKKKDIILSMTTNGTMVPLKINKLKHLDYLILTLDGPRKIHDMQRGVGSYNKVLNAAKIARLNGLTVEFLTVLTKHNIKHIPFLLRIGKKLNCSNVFQPVTKYCLWGNDETELAPTPKEMREGIMSLIKYKKEYKINNSALALKYYLNWPNKKPIKCWAGKMFFALSDDGIIEPCCAIELPGSKRCTDKGFSNAYENIPKFKCEGCWIAANIDFNFIFSLKYKAWKNMFKFLKLRDNEN